MTRFWSKSLIRDAALIVALGCTFFLGYRHYLQSLLGPNETRPRVGDVLEPFDAIDAEGKLVRVDPTTLSKLRVVMVFSPTCGQCAEVAPQWAKVYGERSSSNTSFLGVSLGDVQTTQSFVAAYGLSFPVVAAVDRRKAEAACKLSGWPVIIVVDEQGRVMERWIGVLNEDELRALQELVTR